MYLLTGTVPRLCMQVKTQGIVLHTIAYNDKMSIVQVYTAQFGRAAYLWQQSHGRQ